MRRILRLLSFLFFLTAYGAMASWTVKDVYFVLDGQEDVPYLYSLSGVKRGDLYSSKKVDDALERLGQSGKFRYLEARTVKEKQEVYFVLKSVYTVREIRFSISGPGLKQINAVESLESDLRDAISIKSQDPVDLGLLSTVNQQVVERLESRGFVGSDAITVFQEIPGTQKRDLVINVSLANASYIKDVVFEGFEISTQSKLRKQYRDVSDDFISSKNGLAMLDLVSLNFVLDQYQNEIRAQGFYDANVEYTADFDSGSIRVKQILGTQYKINFKGMVYFWERELRDRVLQRVENFSVPFDPADIITQLTNLYKERGFKDVVVTWTSEDSGSKNKSVTNFDFKIKEGHQYFLDDIVFLGAIGQSEREDLVNVRSSWIAQNSDPFSYIYFDEKALISKSASILDFIKEQGYVESRVIDIRFEPSDTSKFRFNMVVSLQMGQKFFVESLSYSGVSFLNQSILDANTMIKVGDPVQPSRIFETSQRLENYLKDHGFINARAETNVDLIYRKRPTLNKLDLVFQVEAGPKVLVGKTVIEGLGETKEKVVLRELYQDTLFSGSDWSLDGERRLRENLLGLGIFASAQTEKISGRVVGVDPVHNYEIQQKDLKITLRDRPAGSIEFGPGYRTDLGMIGFAEFNYRNLFRENYSFLTRAQVSRKINNFQFYEQNYTATLLDPYFLSQRIRFRTSFSYHKDDDTVFDGDLAIKGFSVEESKVSLSAEFLIAKKWSWIQNVYTFSLPRLFGIINAQDVDRERTEKYKIGTVGSSLIYDGRDNIFNPSAGMYSSSSAEYSGPTLGSTKDVNFVVFRQELNQYFKTGPGSVIALSAEYARLWGFSDSVGGVPVNKRLFLGGQTSLRFLPEKALRFDDEGVQGQHSVEFKAEYRQPWIYDLSIAFFVDVGRVDVLNSVNNAELSTGWRSGMGLGARYATPVGPIAMDFAFNLAPEPSESNYQIQFSIGVF